ncbi:hypothetical protein FJY63_13805, partial [Candidatus Sumerlaeota bacterium]|nr:hypothetical protein [Candidatus Sumerlaeota bacterium]
MRQQLIELFQRHAGQAFSPREILKRLGLPATQRAAVRRALKDLAAEGRVRAFRNQRYGCEASRSSAIGVLSVTLQGTGYVAPDVPPN